MEHLSIVVVFGGSDFESEAAKKVLGNFFKIPFFQATIAGKPVNPGTAYKADGCDGDLNQFDSVVLFECSRGVLPVDYAGEVIICDHHNPGDPGFGKRSHRCWEGSSLGQMIELLDQKGKGFIFNNELYMIAAGDHCPADAYQGHCPGINPVEFGEFRIGQKVEFYSTVPALNHKADPILLRGIINQAVEKIATAPMIEIGDQQIADLRSVGFVDELPEAALETGLPYITEIDETGLDRQPTGNKKIVMGGHTTPEAIEAFLAWAKDLPNRVGEPYGNPIRGFAGVVVTPI